MLSVYVMRTLKPLDCAAAASAGGTVYTQFAASTATLGCVVAMQKERSKQSPVPSTSEGSKGASVLESMASLWHVLALHVSSVPWVEQSWS